jgi:hypothetical protein
MREIRERGEKDHRNHHEIDGGERRNVPKDVRKQLWLSRGMDECVSALAIR